MTALQLHCTGTGKNGAQACRCTHPTGTSWPTQNAHQSQQPAQSQPPTRTYRLLLHEAALTRRDERTNKPPTATRRRCTQTTAPTTGGGTGLGYSAGHAMRPAMRCDKQPPRSQIDTCCYAMVHAHCGHCATAAAAAHLAAPHGEKPCWSSQPARWPVPLHLSHLRYPCAARACGARQPAARELRLRRSAAGQRCVQAGRLRRRGAQT